MRGNSMTVSMGGAFVVGLLTGLVVSMLIKEDLYDETRKKLHRRLKALQIPLKEIDKEKYETVVKELIRDLKFDRGLSDKQIDKLKDYLINDFSRLREGLSYEF